MADDSTTQTIRIVVDSSAARAGADDVKNSLLGVDAAVQQLNATMEALTGFAKGLVIGEVTSWLTDIATHSLEAAAGLENLSQQLGVGIDYLQASNAAALSHGVSIQSLDDAYAHFSKTVGEAAAGGKTQIDLFTSMGVKLLDSAGKLRPTEDIMTDYARSLSATVDPATKAADATGAMGRGGQQLIPVMGDVAQGLDAMSAKAREMGTSIDDGAISKLEALETQAGITKAKLEAVFANNIADPLSNEISEDTKAIQQLVSLLSSLDDWGHSTSISDWLTGTWTSLEAGFQGITQGIHAGMVEALSGLPDLFTAVFTNAMNNALVAIQYGLNTIVGTLNGFQTAHPKLAAAIGMDGDIAPFSFGAIPGTSLDPYGDYTAKIGAAYDKAKSGASAAVLGPYQQQQSDKTVQDAYMAGMLEANQPAGSGGSVPRTVGAANPVPTGTGQSLARTLSRLSANAQTGLDSAMASAGAAGQGVQAVDDLEQHFKDLQQVQDAYIKSGISLTSMTVAQKAAMDQQVATLDKLNDSTRVYNALKSLVLQSGDAKEANDELQQQLDLTGQTTEEIQRQAALAKAAYADQKDGIAQLAAAGDAQAQQAIQDQTDQINRQYDLKAAIDATQKSTQQWLQPFSSAISSIQSDASSMFETIFQGGVVTWQTMVDDMKAIFIKMMAELAATAFMQSVIGPIVQSVFSPGAAQSLGFSGAGFSGLSAIVGGGGGVGAVGGSSNASGGGISSLLGFGSGGSTGSFFSGISSWLNSPIFETPNTATTAVTSLPAFMQSGAAGANGAGGALSGLTWGNALSAGVGFASGAYQLLSGGGSTASTIGGIGSMVGAGVSLIPGLQPLGIGISLLSSILPGLFGGGPQIPPQPALDYGEGSFSYGPGATINTGGSALANGTSLAGTAGTIAQNILELITATGGTPVDGKLYGGTVASGTNYVLNNGQWQPQAYTQANYSDPNGNTTRISYNSSQSLQQTAQDLISAVFQQDIATGAVSGISATLKTALAANTPTTTQDVETDVQMSKAYDELGQTATSAETQIDQITQSFQSLTQWAESVGLALQPINDAQTAAELKVATDYSKSISEGILGITDPLQAQLDSISDAETQAVAEANWMNENITGAFVDMAQVTAYYTDQQQEALKEFYATDISNLQTAIQSLKYGALSGASPADTFAGTQATYLSTLALATGGDKTSIDALSGDATDYVTAARAYYGSTQQYADIVSEVLATLQEEQATLQVGGVGATGATSTDAANAVLSSNISLNNTIASQQDDIQSLTDQVANLTAQLQRIAVNMAA